MTAVAVSTDQHWPDVIAGAPDLESGRWAERNTKLPGLDEIDLGGRLLTAG